MSPLPLDRNLYPDTVLDALADRVGAASGISARALVAHLLGGQYHAAAERQLRHVIEVLRANGAPICATPAHGYFLAETAEDIDQTCLFLYSRAMTSLKQVAAMKRVALPDLRGQFHLPLFEEGVKAA